MLLFDSLHVIHVYVDRVQYRPLFKQFSSWPKINIDFEVGGCPFSPPEASEKRTTPKTVKERGDAAKRTQPTKATAETPRQV